MKATYDRGHAFFNRLAMNCLLEKTVDRGSGDVFKMHDVVRDMAIKSVGLECGYLVKAGMNLRELPSEHEWVKDAKKGSLMYNHISNIPQGFSPKCYTLSTLILSFNAYLKEIPESFFLAISELKVLDLSGTAITVLPDSTSNLENLNALRLKGCYLLEYVPTLSKLKRLKKLDLNDTALNRPLMA